MDLKEIAGGLVAAFNAHDAERVASLYTNDQETGMPGAPEPIGLPFRPPG